MRFALMITGLALAVAVSTPATAAPVSLVPPATSATPPPTLASRVKAKPMRLHTGACARRAWFSH